MQDTYKILRYFSTPGRVAKVRKRGLSIDQARRHCNDPVTSSLTANKGRGGSTCDWFDGFTKE